MSWSKNPNKTNPYIKVKMYDRFGKEVNLDYDGYLFGLMGALKYRKQKERHSLILVAGGVGDGKTSFVEGLAGLDSYFNQYTLNLGDVAWSMDKFLNLLDSNENKGRCIWGDEFIQSGGNRGFALTNIGNRLKIGFVTKRLKENTYFLVADEIQEFPEKLVKMANALFIIKTIYDTRGYFDCYTNPINILFLYKAFKEFNKSWKSPEVKRIRPDSKGKFQNWKGLFLDSEEFDRRKIEETKQSEEDSDKNRIKIYKLVVLLKDKFNMNYRMIAEELDMHSNTIGDYYRRGKAYNKPKV